MKKHLAWSLYLTLGALSAAGCSDSDSHDQPDSGTMSDVDGSVASRRDASTPRDVDVVPRADGSVSAPDSGVIDGGVVDGSMSPTLLVRPELPRPPTSGLPAELRPPR